MKKLLLSMFVVVAMCATSTVMAQDNTKKEASCCKDKEKTECANKKSDKKEGSCCKASTDKKEGTASTDKKACCSSKKATTADNKSAGKK